MRILKLWVYQFISYEIMNDFTLCHYQSQTVILHVDIFSVLVGVSGREGERVVGDKARI